MPREITIDIKESVEFLQEKLSQSKEKLKEDRIKTLLYIKEKKFHFQSDIGDDLGRTEKTIRSWIQEYSKNGYRGLLTVKSGGNNTRTISDKAVKLISKFVKLFSKKKWSPYDFEISSFIELKFLLEKKLGETIDYDALYSHFRRNYKAEFKLLRDLIKEKRKTEKISPRRKEQISKEIDELESDFVTSIDFPEINLFLF